MNDRVWIAVKNPCAKEMNRQPIYNIRHYKVKERRQNSVILMCGKVYPPERCFNTEEEAKASVGNKWKPRKWGDFCE